MKRISICIFMFLFLIIGVYAQPVSFKYVTEFSTPSDIGEPISIAADSNGGIYYTLLSSPESDMSGCFYVPNPFDAPSPEEHIMVDGGYDTSVPVGRGFVGVVVDSSGNVYLAMDSGSDSTSSITKRGPAPDFDWVDEFADWGLLFGARYTGVDILTDDLIAVSTFSTIQFIDANTGEILHEVFDGETYQRDVAYNPDTHEIYIAKNRSMDGILNSANLLAGGSPDDLTGYTEIQPGFIPQGGAGGTYGTKSQLLDYDAVNDLIIIPDFETSPRSISFYNPADTSAPIMNLYGYKSPNGPLSSPTDAVAWTNESGETYVFVTDSEAHRIMVFLMGEEGEYSDNDTIDNPPDDPSNNTSDHPFAYITDFETVAETGAPMALAADSNGGLYYTLFSIPEANMTGCYYISDPLNANGVENHKMIDDGADTDVPSNRGFMGITVDNNGSIYLALETGNASTANLRKFGPAPNFELDTDFGGGIIYYNKRINGVDFITDGIIAMSTFDSVEFLNSSDGASLHVASGGQTYQRDLAYNPNTEDIYISRNSQKAGEPLGSVNLLTGGNADNLAGYSDIQNHFVPRGAIAGTYGGNTQLIEYDSVNNQIIVPDYSGTQPMMVFYDPSDAENPIALVDGSESPNGPFITPTDAVVMHTAQDETFVFISDINARRIYVYQTRGVTNVSNWDLY